MASSRRSRLIPDSLKMGIAVVVVAIVGMGVTLVTGYPLGFPVYVVMEIALVGMAIASVVALVREENRRSPRCWHYLGTFVVAIGLLYNMVIFGLNSYLGLMNLRTRAYVALTGGQDQLQAWAVEVLTKPRDPMEQDGSGWRIPREEWSEQVRRLGPKARLVRIDPLLEGGRNAVRLGYGGGFFHWYIVVGPPGSVPDLKDGPWYRWGDGVYGWFPEN